MRWGGTASAARSGLWREPLLRLRARPGRRNCSGTGRKEAEAAGDADAAGGEAIAAPASFRLDEAAKKIYLLPMQSSMLPFFCVRWGEYKLD